MPPKKDAGGKAKPSAAKVVEDKTFGMKNKKGSSAQKQIKAIQSQASSSKTPEQKRKEAEKAAREREKAASEAAKRETAELFKPVQVQKVPFGVDPKTVVCQFFKQGSCEKGKKCKFSHDLEVGRKSAKKDVYQDTREGEVEEGREEGEEGNDQPRKEDDMSSWDEAKLRHVVLSKHGNPKTTTAKICKYFIDAVEQGKYGWFWTCPNGGDRCMYKHSLPPGFILKTASQRLAERALAANSPLQTLTLEEYLETTRAALTGNLTPVTETTFAKWKKERMDKKAAEEQARREKEATGRAMFEAGGWEESEGSEEGEDLSEEEEQDGREDGEDGFGEEDGDGRENKGEWDLHRLRRETERIREEDERRRVEGVVTNGDS